MKQVCVVLFPCDIFTQIRIPENPEWCVLRKSFVKLFHLWNRRASWLLYGAVPAEFGIALTESGTVKLLPAIDTCFSYAYMGILYISYSKFKRKERIFRLMCLNLKYVFDGELRRY